MSEDINKGMIIALFASKRNPRVGGVTVARRPVQSKGVLASILNRKREFQSLHK